MHRGTISKRMLLVWSLSIATASLLMPVSSVQAQQNNPEIYVDMDVLEQLDPGDQSQPQAPVKLKSPSSKQIPQPRLTVPNSSSNVSKPLSMPADVIDRGYVSQSDPNDTSTMTFPIKTRTRTETSDPAASGISRPVPIRSGIAGNLNDTSPSRPAVNLDTEFKQRPIRDPTEKTVVVSKPRPLKTEKKAPVVPIRKPEHATDVAALPVEVDKPLVVEQAVETKKPPIIPPRRPDNVQRASPELVAELRARELNKKHIPLKAGAADVAQPLPPPGPMGRKNMPAVAKPAVDTEQLPELVNSRGTDPLLDRLVEKDKESLVATIESMVDAREDGKLLPRETKAKRELGTNIVKAEPLQRPYNVYRPKKSGDVAETEPDTTQERIDATKEIEVASIPERPPVVSRPRSPDEQAYISVPFDVGLNQIDEVITGEIEAQLLPVLNDNPGSKLQIHAFASPSKDGASSARKMSLDRAMSIRTYLIGKGIDATRMNIRAVGSETEQEPLDRVDLIVFNPAKKS